MVKVLELQALHSISLRRCYLEEVQHAVSKLDIVSCKPEVQVLRSKLQIAVRSLKMLVQSIQSPLRRHRAAVSDLMYG